MKALIICDSFKESLSSAQANAAIARACDELGISHDTQIISDGGEGFLDCIEPHLRAQKIYLELDNAVQTRKIRGYYLLSDKLACLEMSQFAGLDTLAQNERNPMKANTRSLGIAIKDAISKGAREFIIGIGGSATNDAGTGMLAELGYRFLDISGALLEPNGENLINIESIDASGALEILQECKFSVACDVLNPLHGTMGAAKIYARQKGANDDEIEILDAGLSNFAYVSEYFLSADYSEQAGAGAAGGLGFGLKAFLRADFISGFSLIKDFLQLESAIAKADIVISGEGAFDTQSMMGKALGEISKLCKDKKLVIFCGINKSNFSDVYSLAAANPELNTQELMQNSAELLYKLALKALPKYL